MLALRTGPTVAGIDWSTATVDLDDGTLTTTWTGSTSVFDIVDAMDELTAHATTNLTHTYSWTWARDATTGGAIVTMSVDTGTFTIEATSQAADDGLGLDQSLHGAAASQAFDDPAAGTWAPASQVAIYGSLRVIGRGDAGADGAIRPGVPGTGTYRPVCSATGTPIDAGRLAAVLAQAESPRRGQVWQVHTSGWLSAALGQVTRQPRGLKLYGFDLELSGEPV